MKKKYPVLNTFFILEVLTFIGLLSSCTPVKNLVYFQNLQKDTTLHKLINNNIELKIRKNDLLSINIISPDLTATPLFNGAQGTSSGNTGTGSTAGYLVDNNGNIIIYKLGSIHVEGLTRNELREKLQKVIVPDYLKEAIITVRFLSNHIIMLGEIAKPGVLTMPNEEISLLEAIAQSGDITFTGRKDNILVIRETSSGKQFKRINLNDNSIFYSPFYYLKPDDVVYVEPSENKIKNASQIQQTLSYILSGLSIIITIYTLLRH